MAGQTSEQNRSVIRWLLLEVLVLLVVLIGYFVVTQSGGSSAWVYGLFGFGLFFAVFVLPVWAIWGLPEGESH